MSAPQGRGDILIVDDTPANLQLLSGMLKERGYRARAVPSGKLALQAAAAEPPDLILLDITMPDMDGYQVCTRLKADPKLAHIPVIFLSALTETLDKVKAFSAGGVDYVAKPFQFEEVEARVEAHLRLERQRRELEQAYRTQRELEQARDGLVHMIVHDLRSPLTGMQGFLELLAMDADQFNEEQRDYVTNALESTRRLVSQVASLLDVHRFEAGELKLDRAPQQLGNVVDRALAALGSLTKDRVIRKEGVIAEPVSCDGGLVERVIMNLVANALRHTPQAGTITVAVTGSNGTARVEVRDTGAGIKPEYHARIFEKFGQVEARRDRQRGGTGLGLTFCRLAVEAHGGTIGVESSEGQGSTFWFTLPQTAPAAAHTA